MKAIKKAIKKPIEIEYEIWDGSNESMMRIISLGILRELNRDEDGKLLYIETLAGVMTASLGDYIIKGVVGEIYPCKPDIFIKTYDLITPTN